MQRKKGGEQKGDVKVSWSRYGAGFLPLPTGAQALLSPAQGNVTIFRF